MVISSPMDRRIEFDGSSRPNPGKSGAGAVIRDEYGRVQWRLREGLGHATSNIAEYRGLILGLRFALEKGYTRVHAQGDSQLVCNQVQRVWKTKDAKLKTLNDEVLRLADRFQSFKICHVMREENSEADALANSALDLEDGENREERCFRIIY